MAEPESAVGRSLGAMVSSSIASAITGVILMFWIPRLLSVEDFGYWRSFLLYSSYAGFMHLGLIDGALLHWSRPLGRRPGASFRQALGVLLTQHLMLGAIGLMLLLTPLARRPHFPSILIAVLVYALFFNLLGLVQVYLQAQVRFTLVAVGMTGTGVLFVSLLTALRGWAVTLETMLMAYLAAWGLTALILWTVALRLHRAEALEHPPGQTAQERAGVLGLAFVHVRAGWPIMLANTGYGLMQSADRMTVNLFRSIHDFAIYSLSQSTIYVPITIIVAVSRVAFSHFARITEEQQAAAYQSTVRLLTLLWALLLPYFFVVEWVVGRFLPKYVPGLPAGRVLLLSVLFLSLISIVQANTFSLLGRQRQYFYGSLGAVALAFATAWIGSRWFNSLTAVAWSQVLSASLWWLANEWAMRSRRLLPGREIGRVLAAFAGATGSLSLAGAATHQGTIAKILIYYGLAAIPFLLLFRDEIRNRVGVLRGAHSVAASQNDNRDPHDWQ